MLRFIFVCMGIVALSVLSIGMQSMTDGIDSAQTRIAERNAPQTETDTVVAMETPDTEMAVSPEDLNEINTAAGDTYDPGFGESFSNEAPKALADDPAPQAMLPATDATNAANSTY